MASKVELVLMVHPAGKLFVEVESVSAWCRENANDERSGKLDKLIYEGMAAMMDGLVQAGVTGKSKEGVATHRRIISEEQFNEELATGKKGTPNVN